MHTYQHNVAQVNESGNKAIAWLMYQLHSATDIYQSSPAHSTYTAGNVAHQLQIYPLLTMPTPPNAHKEDSTFSADFRSYPAASPAPRSMK
jgi:hypothetical protein